MPEETELTLRQLPGGRVVRAREVARRVRQIEIELQEEAPGLKAGALVEISTEDSILLGELQSRSGQRLDIVLEHAVDRVKVAAIQALWARG